MHYNENSERLQLENEDGSLRYHVKFLKFKKGAFSIAKSKGESTYGKFIKYFMYLR